MYSLYLIYIDLVIARYKKTLQNKYYFYNFQMAFGSVDEFLLREMLQIK